MVGLKELSQLDYGVQFQRGQPSATQVSGLAGLAAPSTMDIARANEQTIADMRNLGSMPRVKPSAPLAPESPTAPQTPKPVLAISRSTGKIWANGKLFTADDAQGAIESEQFLAAPPAPAPLAEAGDWEPLSPEAYTEHIQKIKNPSLTTLAAKNFGIGVDNMQMLAGYGAQFLGATETGQGIVRQQVEDIRRNQPYQRSLEDIPERGAVEWLVANVAQQGANLIESVVSLAAGAAIGGLVGGGPNPFTAVGGAMSAMVGKQAFKQAVMTAVQKQVRGEVLDAAEEKLLREVTGMTLAATKTLADDTANVFGGRTTLTNLLSKSAGARNQAMAGGAALSSIGSNYAMGVADLYGESIEGGEPDRLMAALGGTLYAAAETLPEYVAALKFFQGIGKKAITAGAKGGRAGTIATNVGIGAGAGAVLEGTTEVGQELLGIGMNAAVDVDSPEGVSRLLNAFAAGAAIGGLVGGASSLNTGKPTDLLSGGTKPADQGEAPAVAPDPGAAAAAPYNYLGPLATPSAPPAAPTAAMPQGELFPGAAMGQAPAQVPTGPMMPPAAPTGQTEFPFVPGARYPVPAVVPAPVAAQPILDRVPGGSALAQVAAGGLPQAQPPGAMMLRRGGGSALAQTAEMQGPAMPMPGAPQQVIPTLPSALSQVSEGGLPQAAPTGQFVNRLQAQQAAAQEQARQAELQATSGSALARIGRGEMVPPINEPGGRVSMGGEATGQMVEPMSGKAKLKRQRKGKPLIEGMPSSGGDAVSAATNLAETWDRANRNNRSDEWFANGTAESNPAFNAVAQDAQNIPAHGMAKVSTLTKGLRDLISLLTGEGNPKLYTDALARPKNQFGVGAATGTGGGVAYRDGPFIITFRQGSKDTSPANVTGILVNPAHPEMVAPLQEMFPNLTVRTYDQVADVVAASKLPPGPKGQTLKQGGRSPKAEGAAAAPSEKAETPKPEAPKKPAKSKVKYEDLTEEERIALAKEGERQGEAIATAMEREQDIPDLPAKATKKQADLYEVYGTIGNIVLAQRENRAKTSGISVKAAAKKAFIGDVGTLYNWVTSPGLHPTARNTARAYLETYISASKDVDLKAGIAQAIKDARDGKFMLSSFDTTTNPVDEKGRPARGVNEIKVKAIVDTFRKGLAKAPTFHVYRNQTDLKRRNPSLYARAAAARPQGDFDTAPASGYAFDTDVVVFTDRIPTEKYMRLLLAHEAIGHFGMRSLLPAAKFDALMDYVYDNSPSVRLSVDGNLKGSTDLGARREAVEEHMAKFAEVLDSSILMRVWNAIKSALNKLGVKFDDDIVRYLVSQARSTVRNGSSMFVPSQFALNVQTVMTNNGTGRFSTEPVYSAQHAMRTRLELLNAQPAKLKDIPQIIKNFKVNSKDNIEYIVRNVFRLRNYNALRNHGALVFEHLKDAMRTAAQALRNTWNERLAKLLALTGDSRRRVSYALVISRRIADRRFALDKELRTAALLTLGDEQPDGTRATAANQSMVDKLLKLGTLSKQELDDGAEVTYEDAVGDGTYKKTTVKIDGVKKELGRGLTDEEYAIYVQTRRDLADLDIERLKAQYDNFFFTEKVSTAGIRKVLADKTMTDEDVKFVRDVINHAKKLFADDIEYDERGIPDPSPQTAMRMEQYFKALNTAVVAREFTDELKAEVRKFYLPKPGKDADGNVLKPSAEALAEGNKKAEAAIKKVEDFRSRRTEFSGKEEQSVIYTLQDRVKEIVLADAAFEKAQAAVRRSIASSHVALWREGAFQVRVEAQINGVAVKLHPEVQNKLLYSLHEKVADAENAAKFYNDTMKDIEYSGLVYNKETGEYKTQTFTLFAKPSKTVDSVASEPSIDIDNFLYTLRVIGQPLTPDKHAKAIVKLTAPGSALRKALRFDDSPGYDIERTIEAVARHVTTRSSLIARTRFQPLMRELMDLSTESGSRWFGDAEAVMTAKEKLDGATDPKQKAYWQDRLNTELYRYTTTNPGAKGWDGSRAKFPGRPAKADLGMRDYSDAVKELEWLVDASNINESTFEGKRYAALMKMLTSVGFLGGMMTQFAQNLMAPATNVLPFLASKDSQTGFGGGFGMAVMPTYLKAFKDVVGGRGLNPFTDPIKDAQRFEEIAAKIKVARDANNAAAEAKLVQQYGLSYYEALNIAREIRDGKLIPAQANALLETARGVFTGTASRMFLKFSDIYMAPFNVSEQATRRATFLTAFRLEFNRLKEAGIKEEQASEMARLFAVETVDKTLGEYSNTNRPPVWRDGALSLLFVYKTYPLTSLLLFKNMSRAGKIGMLTSLYVLAGVAGFPLVDDLEDLIDTLSQRFGMDFGQGPSLRMFLINQLEEFFPGWSDMILRGPLNHYTGADVGAKFGLEDFVPGTGIFLKGANTTEELKGIAGPVIGMGLSMGEFLYALGRAPFSSTTSLLDATREAPISLVRAAGDVAAYMQNGAIVDRRGYVVAPDVSASVMIFRLLGFYPAEAARQYEFIKYANRVNNDYKEVGVAYRMAWVRAMMVGDHQQAVRIEREVNDWNASNKGGPGEIRNFRQSAQKALQEAKRPAGERFLRSAPVAARESYDRFLGYIAPE